MNKIILKTTLLLCAIVPSFAAFGAGQLFWTRGFSTTTTNNVFTSDNGSTLSERFIYVTDSWSPANLTANHAANFDTTTGMRTSGLDVTTADSTDAWRIGYINSGLTGSGTTQSMINLNGNLSVSRLGIMTAALDTATVPLGITSSTNSTLSLTNDVKGYELLWFEANATTTTNAKFTLDVNLKLTLTSSSTAQGV